MIRPRTGDFLYSPIDLDVMTEDIRQFSLIGVSGVVFGALNADGTVDIKMTTLLTKCAVGFGLEGEYELPLATPKCCSRPTHAHR